MNGNESLFRICGTDPSYVPIYRYQGTALAAGGLMLIPAILNWRMLPSKGPTNSAGDDKGKQKGGGLNLGEIVNVVKIPACWTLTVYMMLTGLAGSIYHSTFSMAASSQFGMDAK
jgi:hypothetical protein